MGAQALHLAEIGKQRVKSPVVQLTPRHHCPMHLPTIRCHVERNPSGRQHLRQNRFAARVGRNKHHPAGEEWHEHAEGR